MAKNTPAFQYYPADLISDPKVMFWDMETIGCYWQMITYLWLNGGEFEFKSEDLRILFHLKSSKKAETLWLKIKEKFILKDGIVSHKRVTVEMEKQAISRSKRQIAGQKGAKERWKTDSNANGNAIKKDMAKNSPSSSTSSSTTITTLKSSSQQTPIDLCPHQGIVNLYHEVLPELRGVKVWNNERQRNLRARWRENTKRQNLDYWKRLFLYIKESDFLMGKTEKPFSCDLGWIVNSSNFVKIIEGKYHGGKYYERGSS